MPLKYIKGVILCTLCVFTLNFSLKDLIVNYSSIIELDIIL